jgi:peptide/nickel transport system substrate-binding protein
MKKVTLLILSLILICSTAILSFSCGEPEETTTPSSTQPTGTQPTSTQPTSTQPTSTQPTTTPPPTGGPMYGGTIKISYNGESALGIGDPRNDHMMGNIMVAPDVERLARFDNNAKLQPWLAESWSADAAAKTFTLTVKQGIKFHDGTDFNAAAVKFVWELFQANNMRETELVSSIDLVDEYTVRVNLTQWDNSIELKLLHTAGAMISPTAWETQGEDWASNNPVGTGPFKFVSWVREVGSEFERWDDYWREGEPYLDTVEFVYISDETTRVASFISGETDVYWNASALNAKNLEDTGNYVVLHDRSGFDTPAYHLVPDVETCIPFQDVNVRKAAAYAIDRQSILDTIYYGYGVVNDQWGIDSNWAHSPNVIGYEYNPEKARQLMADAGYADGFDCDLLGFTGMETVFEAFQVMLADVGIRANINIVSKPAMYEYIIGGGWNGLMYPPRRPDGHIPYRMSIHLMTTSLEGPGVYHSEELDNMILAALAAPDFASQQAAAWALQEYVYNDLCIYIPIVVLDGLHVKYPYVQDDNFGTAGNTFWTPETAWLDK